MTVGSARAAARPPVSARLGLLMSKPEGIAVFVVPSAFVMSTVSNPWLFFS